MNKEVKKKFAEIIWAFPLETRETVQFGMTLRDYFAAKAMAALVQIDVDMSDKVAKEAYEIADAMLTERVKQ